MTMNQTLSDGTVTQVNMTMELEHGLDHMDHIHVTQEQYDLFVKAGYINMTSGRAMIKMKYLMPETAKNATGDESVEVDVIVKDETNVAANSTVAGANQTIPANATLNATNSTPVDNTLPATPVSNLIP